MSESDIRCFLYLCHRTYHRLSSSMFQVQRLKFKVYDINDYRFRQHRGSGVQADIRTISELGGYAVSAITSISVRSKNGIQEFFDIPAEIVSEEAKSTQGFGLIYKEDFESVGDMLNYYWKIITGITKKKKNE